MNIELMIKREEGGPLRMRLDADAVPRVGDTVRISTVRKTFKVTDVTHVFAPQGNHDGSPNIHKVVVDVEVG